MKLKTLINEIEVKVSEGSLDKEVHGITCVSSQVRAGFIFVAIPGHNQDGRSFIGEAIERGAIAVVAEQSEGDCQENGSNGGNICCILVNDARQALGELSTVFHGRPSEKMKLVGITGTNGKTTVSYMIRDVLRSCSLEPGMIGTVEYEIGQRVIPASRTTPEAAELQFMLAQMTQAGCKSAVMEVSSHALVQKRTVGVDFDVAVFTNMTRDHLDYHKTLEEYFEAKSLLFRNLDRQSKKAVAAINSDDPWGRKLVDLDSFDNDVITFGINSDADVKAIDIELDSGGSKFKAITPWGDMAFELKLLGRFNISNALAAITACGILGIDLESMKKALSSITHVPGRLEEVKNKKGFQIFVDYAHTDDALGHVLTTLREITGKRLIVVFGCGGNRDKTKRSAMGSVAGKLADYTILTSDNPRNEEPLEIIAQIREGFAGAADNLEIIEDRKDAIRRALSVAQKGDTVLIAGKGHENFQEFSNRTLSFDDRQVAKEILEDL